MSTLLLVRHGQASFGARNYDELSPLGHRQSQVLGEHWRDCGLGADLWCSGDMERQKSTGTSALAALGQPDEPIQQDAAFNEYDHVGLIHAYAPVVAREHPELARDKLEGADRKTFQRFFEKVIHHWLDGREGASPVRESWAGFCARCNEGVRKLAASGAERMVVFTSGGAITAALAEALGLEGRAAFQLNWRIYNASVHEFRIGKRGLSLVGYNNISHLQRVKDPALLTFR